MIPLSALAGGSGVGIGGLTGGGPNASSSATSGPASNRSINIIGANPGDYSGLAQLLAISQGSPANGGTTGSRPYRALEQGNPASGFMVPLLIVGAGVLLWAIIK